MLQWLRNAWPLHNKVEGRILFLLSFCDFFTSVVVLFESSRATRVDSFSFSLFFKSNKVKISGVLNKKNFFRHWAQHEKIKILGVIKNLKTVSETLKNISLILVLFYG